MPPKFFKKKTYKSNNNNGVVPINVSAKYLVIVESPSKCKKIEEYLGSDYACISSKGHIRSIENLTAIDTKRDFAPTFSLIDDKKDHVAYMRGIIGGFSKNAVILATDDDREGEAISWHICMVFDLPVETTRRIVFHEITKTAILAAVANPATINMNIVHAQQARQILDVIVGFKISPFLWKYICNNKNNGLSAGRCQTPALRLVYDNDISKKALSGTSSKYKIVGNFFSKNIPFCLQWSVDDEAAVLEFLKKSIDYNHKMTIGQAKECRRSPSKPFNTSQLLQCASNRMGLSPKETMNLCQQLYQAGHITYMRTDSTKYADLFLEQAREFIETTYGSPDFVGDLDKLRCEQNLPHEAIRVTHIEMRTILATNKQMITLYRLIWRNTVESCMSDARFSNTVISMSAPMSLAYEHLIEVPIFMGWKQVMDCSDSSSSDEDEMVRSQSSASGQLLYLKSVKADSVIPYNVIDCTVTVERKHKHYSEATLIQKLEDLGIGRPSTFAQLVDTIQERGYVKRTNIAGDTILCNEFKLTDGSIVCNSVEKVFGSEKNKLVIQSIGILSVEFLIKHFDNMFSYDYTKRMEDRLDQISSEDSIASVCRDCYDEIKALSKPINALTKRTWKIDEEHELVFHQYGASLRHIDSDGAVSYKPVKDADKLDLARLEAGSYLLSDLLEIQNDYLGKYEGVDMFIRLGRYGPYVEFGDKKESVKSIDKPISSIVLADVVEMLEAKPALDNSIVGDTVRLPPPPSKNASILRVLSNNMSVRKGKFGAYIYYKRSDMKDPEFYNIKNFKQGFAVCDAQVLMDWVATTYNVRLT